jgi:hypothetical protein
MEVQNNPNPDEVTEPCVAKAGESYPIRLLHLLNDMLIIGFVIAVYPETTMILRPYIVDPEFDPVKRNITEYDFEPYLNQLMHYDPHELSPVPFMNASTISITRPAAHLVQNYTSIIQLRQAVQVAEEKGNSEIYKREYVDTKTRH